MVAVHLPHRDLALAVLPEDVGLAVAAEVRDVGHVPVGYNRSDRGVGGNMVAVHLPHRNLAAVVVQEDVGLAVIAEVADAIDMPARGGHRTLRGVHRNMVAGELP